MVSIFASSVSCMGEIALVVILGASWNGACGVSCTDIIYIQYTANSIYILIKALHVCYSDLLYNLHIGLYKLHSVAVGT
jgi:hypothetical protein